METTDRDTRPILRLIAEGENLNPKDLEAFYRWVRDSYEALEFDPLHQQRFEEYCRSSYDSISTRVFVGVWILKLAVQETSSDRADHRDHVTSSESIPYPSGKSSSGSRAKSEAVGFSGAQVPGFPTRDVFDE